MKIISVVRDFEMYDRLVRNNPFNKGADFSCFDNRQENLGIAARYNQFLNGYDFADEDWLIFCHEDWEVREAWQPLLERLDKNRLYGVAGIRSFRFGFRIGYSFLFDCTPFFFRIKGAFQSFLFFLPLELSNI